MKAKVKVKFKPHEGQISLSNEIRKSKAKFFTIAASRGFGKTAFILGDIIVPYALKNPGVQIMWVAPVNSVARTPIDEFFTPLVPKFLDEENKKPVWRYLYQKNEIHFYNGSKIFFKSAESPDSIVSKSFNVIVVDEAALIPATVFQQQILACARVGNPAVFLISTPRGRNWFYEYYQRGLDETKPMYFSAKRSWRSRPDYPKFLIEQMKELPPDIQKQEYEAEFLDKGGLVFQNINNILTGSPIYFEGNNQFWEHQLPPDIDTSYVVGVDFAKETDFTVVTVMDCIKKEVIEFHRFNKKPYNQVLKLIESVSNKYHGAEVIYDATGVGAGIEDFMSKTLNCIPFKFTNESKNALIQRLILSFDTKELILPNINTLRLELESFSFEITRTGKISYNAPAGLHDDCVISIALCNLYAHEHYSPQEVQVLEDIIDLNRQPDSFWDFIEDDDN